MNEPDRPLELASAQMRTITRQITEMLFDVIEELDRAPASRNVPAPELLEAALRPPPETPRRLAVLLDLTRRAAAASVETAGPSYLAYIPGGGVPAAAVAEFLAAGCNRYTGRAALAPALVGMERSVLAGCAT